MRSFESCYRSRPGRRQSGATRGRGAAAEAALEGLGAAVDLCQRMGIEKEESEVDSPGLVERARARPGQNMYPFGVPE